MSAGWRNIQSVFRSARDEVILTFSPTWTVLVRKSQGIATIWLISKRQCERSRTTWSYYEACGSWVKTTSWIRYLAGLYLYLKLYFTALLSIASAHRVVIRCDQVEIIVSANMSACGRNIQSVEGPTLDKAILAFIPIHAILVRVAQSVSTIIVISTRQSERCLDSLCCCKTCGPIVELALLIRHW